MALTPLKKLVPPPDTPLEVGTLTQWRECEEALGLKLPRDYRDFVFAYGTGLFANFYRVYNPFARSKYTRLRTTVEQVCISYRQLQQSFPGRHPYAFYPDKGGLLPWGDDENGNYYFWVMEKAPSNWQVVQDNVRGIGFKRHALKMTEFLEAVLLRKIKPLATGYPKKSDFHFAHF